MFVFFLDDRFRLDTAGLASDTYYNGWYKMPHCQIGLGLLLEGYVAETGQNATAVAVV